VILERPPLPYNDPPSIFGSIDGLPVTKTHLKLIVKGSYGEKGQNNRLYLHRLLE
jgi:hypothetical protein